MSDPKFKILFVDDETQVLNSMRRMLGRERGDWDTGFESKPEYAIERVRSRCPDVVVTDLNMPVLTGIEMIAAMRKTVPPETAFIVLTGAGDLSSAIDAINEARVFRFLTKPCPAEDLLTAIDAAVASRMNGRQVDTESLANAALSQLSPAVVVVDTACRVIYLNDSAGELISRKDGLTIDAGGICRAICTETSVTLRDTVVSASRHIAGGPYFLTLPRALERRDLKVVVQMVARERIALYLTDPERTTVPSLDSLTGLFGLTKAEALVAHTLANGGTLEDASEYGGITMSSVRTYLKRVFLKMGVARQSELVQVVLSTPIPFVRQTRDHETA